MIERIRKQMIKNPSSKLWDKDFKRWNDKDKADFEKLENGVIIKKIERRINVNAIKVLRVSDGKIYHSITECAMQNDFHKIEMQKQLNENINFKRL